jgi:hypothetical protein
MAQMIHNLLPQAVPTVLPNGDIGLGFVQQGQLIGGLNVTQLLVNAFAHFTAPKDTAMEVKPK